MRAINLEVKMSDTECQTVANTGCHAQNNERQLTRSEEPYNKCDDGNMLAIQQAWASYMFLVKTRSNIENIETTVKKSMASNMR
jgi:hypothetical protein